MRFKKVNVDRMEGDNPDSLSRTAKVQRRIATSLIRPTSANTGEQREILKNYEDYGDLVSPDTFSKSIKDDKYIAESRDKQLTKAMGTAELYKNAMHTSEAELVSMRQDNPRGAQDAEWALDGLRGLYAQESEKIERLASPSKPGQTSKHVTLAALLGKHAVGYALSDSNPEMRKERTGPYSLSPDYETPDGPTGVWNAADLGTAKATHRANTRNLTRGQRLKERIAPYRAVVHELSDAYGGAEEGGWVYETGTPVHTSRGFVTARGAAKEVEKLKTKYTRAKNGRNILSMSPSDVYDMDVDQGVFEPQEYTDNWAKAHLGNEAATFIQEPDDEDYDYSHFGQHSNDYKVNLAYGNIGNYPKRRPRYE
jgi:hypothetical protein